MIEVLESIKLTLWITAIVVQVAVILAMIEMR